MEQESNYENLKIYTKYLELIYYTQNIVKNILNAKILH